LPDANRSIANIFSVLGIDETALAPRPIRNASTSRVKTLIPLKSAALLDGLRPDFARIERICEAIGSTGLYPFAVSDAERHVFDARQFPKTSGYPEDAATGIAAAPWLLVCWRAGRLPPMIPSACARAGRLGGLRKSRCGKKLARTALSWDAGRAAIKRVKLVMEGRRTPVAVPTPVLIMIQRQSKPAGRCSC
jgi:hypothetical protein